MKADTNATANLAKTVARSKGQGGTPIRLASDKNSKQRSRKARRLAPTALAIVSDSLSEGEQLGAQQNQQSQKAEKVFGLADVKGRLAVRFAETFGTTDPALQDQLLGQVASTVSDPVGREFDTLDHLSAALHGIRPKDSLEGMLATQMVAVHTLAMTCMGRAAWKDQPDVGVEVYINRANKIGLAQSSVEGCSGDGLF